MLTLAGLAQAAETAGAADAAGMTEMMDLMLIVMYIGGGLYCLYLYFTQRGLNAVPENKMICPGDCAPQKCKEPEAFVGFMMPRLALLGVGLIVCGGLYILAHYLGNTMWLTVSLMILSCCLLVWYVTAQRKAAKRFW